MYLRGLLGVRIWVEADVGDGLPGFSLVGYLASELKEAQERVRTAIKNLNLHLLPKKITVNLSPADFKKGGTGFDLAIAAAILSAYGAFPDSTQKDAVFLGELGLDGRVKGIPGILALTDQAKKCGFHRIFLSAENAEQAAIIDGIDLIPVRDLAQLHRILTGKEKETPYKREAGFWERIRLNEYDLDFCEVNGQPLLKRAAEVAAAGMHNLLIVGPAGSGKTMVAKRMPTIMPRLSLTESIEISKIYSVSRLLSEQEPLLFRRPFRAPHHSVSPQGLTGGGSSPRPGEISLATGGILFLDELPEMSRQALESLRQPLEEHKITVTRVRGSYSYPADFQLLAAMNPCLCGHYPNMDMCTCTEAQRRRYLGKISRPLLDRIDICVETSPPRYQDLAQEENETSAVIRERVERARKIQRERFAGLGIQCNGQMSAGQVRRFCRLDKKENEFLETVFSQMGLSLRSMDKILKVARTAADLAGSEEIGHIHLCEAVSYGKTKERYWGN